MKRFFSFIAFRLVPLFLIVALVYFGYQIVQSVSRVWSEQSLYAQRSGDYALTATALASPVSVSGISGIILANYERPIVEQAFVTNTPRPEVESPAATETLVAPESNAPAETQPDAQSEAGQPTATLPPLSEPGAVPTIFFPESAAEGMSFNGTAVPTIVPAIDRQGSDLVNILLMGQDNEITGESLARTDTMIILSVNRTAGTVAMLSLPRDLYVYLLNGRMDRINTVFAWGNSMNWDGGTFFYVRQVLLYNLGINVHYYALVDLSGFAQAIDLLGTVEVGVDCPIIDYPLIGAEVPSEATEFSEDGEWLLPIGYYELTGKEALWYARSRTNSDDFDRGRRQQLLLRAAWRRARDNGLITQLPTLWQTATEIFETNIPFDVALSLVPYAINLNPNTIQNYTLIRTYQTIPWTTPDGDNVQVPVPDKVAELMTDFYTPPTQNQLADNEKLIRVVNGTSNADWERVAAQRLGWDSLNAVPGGAADRIDYAQTMVIDYSGESKGSRIPEITRILNIRPENVIVQPDPNRTVEYEVIIGADYEQNSCTYNVLTAEEMLARK
jgi:LCP family protein required for cell wall assembly